MRGPTTATIARHGISMSLTSVKQWKTSVAIITVFLLLFAPETKAMPKNPRQTAERKNPVKRSFIISVKRDRDQLAIPIEGAVYNYYPYEAGLFLETSFSPDATEWRYHYSPVSVSRKQVSLFFAPLPEINDKIIRLENFIPPNQQPGAPGQAPAKKTLPQIKGYHYFSFKKKGDSTRKQATIVEIRVNTELHAHITPEDFPPLPETPRPYPQSFPGLPPLPFPPTPPLENLSFENPPTPPEENSIEPLCRYSISLDLIKNAGIEAHYRIENYQPGEIAIDPPPIGGITPEGIFSNHLKISLSFYRPGIKKISVSYGGHTQLYTFEVSPPPREPTVVLFNANDNNRNHKPDYQDDPFPDAPSIEDPELTPINLLGDSWMYYFPPWELGNDEFFSNYGGCRFKLTATDGIKLWDSQTRHSQPVFERIISYDQRNSIRQWLQTPIYVEGIDPSGEDGQENVILQLLTPNGELLSDRLWPVTVLHLYVNHDSPGPDFENINRNSKLNTIKNPAVIVSNVPPDSQEKNWAHFAVESSNPDLLKQYEHLIEWRTQAQDGPNRPLLLDAKQDDNGYFAVGRKASVLGLRPTVASISIRLTGAEEDYLSFRKIVVQPIRIPLVLHFFSEQPEQGYLDKILHLQTTIRESLATMNIIGRQAGILFEMQEADPQDSIACYTNELFMEVTKTQFRMSNLPKSFTLREPGNITPPATSRGADLFFEGYETGEDGEEAEPFCSGILYRVEGNKAYVKPETVFAEKGTIAPDQNFILRPYLSLPDQPYQTEIFEGTFLHKNVPGWLLSKQPTSYCTAIASMADVVNINFVNSLHDSKLSKLSAAIAPFDTAITPGLLSEEKPVTIATHFQYNAIPKLGDKNIAATLYSSKRWLKNFPHKLPFQGHHLVRSILETLGLQPLGLTGDMSFYQDEAERNQALHENILVERKNLLFINPISPSTDHTALPANYQPHNIMRGEYFPSGGDKSHGPNLKINTVQAALLHIHPLPQTD